MLVKHWRTGHAEEVGDDGVRLTAAFASRKQPVLAPNGHCAVILPISAPSSTKNGYSAHARPPFRRMRGRCSGPWEASEGGRPKVVG